MEHGSRTRLLSAVVIAAVFGAGVLVGFAADSSLSAESTEAIESETAVAAEVVEAEPEAERPRGTRLTRMLDPTPQQLDRIDAIVAEHRARTNALDSEMRTALRKGFREILLETRTEIQGVFSPEKAAEYQRLADEHDAERENRDDRK